MKKYLVIIFSLISILTSGQSVIIGKYPKTVPEGKKWILQTNSELLIEVPHGTLVSGTLCNALILSNPKIVQGIVEGDFGRPNEVYGILFKDLYKVAYTNNYTYSIIPLAIIDSKFDTYELQNKQPEEVGKKQIFFYPGKKLYVGECLESLQLIEAPLTAKEILEIKQKAEAKRKEESKKALELTDKKNKDEIDRRNKIISSDNYFYANDLTNENDFQIIFEIQALEILYDYFKAFKEKYPIAYNKKIDIYHNNVGSSENDEYSMFTLSIFFNKSGELTKITNNRLFMKTEGANDTLLIPTNDGMFSEGSSTKDMKFDSLNYTKLKPLIKLTKAGSIKLDNKDYLVNFYTLMFFNFHVSSLAKKILIHKNKKGEMQIIENGSNVNISDLTALILRDEKYSILKKGKYLFTINTTTTKLIASHFQDFNKKINKSSQQQKSEITNITEF